jgi:hypothetical protein
MPGADKVPSLLSHAMPYALLDVYLVFIVQSATLALPAIFAVFCAAIREASTKLGNDMIDDRGGDDLDEFRRRFSGREEITCRENCDKICRYEALQDATELLEKHFSTIILCVYICVVPITCFILYSFVNGGAETTFEMIVLALWLSDNIGVMIYYTIPAFSLDEQVCHRYLSTNFSIKIFKIIYNKYTHLRIF